MFLQLLVDQLKLPEGLLDVQIAVVDGHLHLKGLPRKAKEENNLLVLPSLTEISDTCKCKVLRLSTLYEQQTKQEIQDCFVCPCGNLFWT